MRNVDETVKPVKVNTHDHPILILGKVREVIEFLGKYTSYKEYCNGDILRMRQEVKDGCFMVSITNYDLLKKDIMITDFPDIDRFFETEYPDHYIHIHRMPFGIYKKILRPEFIE